jgi:WD40 repeat protein
MEAGAHGSHSAPSQGDGFEQAAARSSASASTFFLRPTIVFQPPAWAPNIDVELELSGAEDPCEVLECLSAIKAVSFSSDGGCLAAGCQDGFIRTVRIDTNERNLALCMGDHHRLGASSPFALLEGDLLQYIVRLIPVEALRLGGHVARAELSSGGSSLVSAVAFAPDGLQIAAATLAGRIVFFDYCTGQKTGFEIACGVQHSLMALVFISSTLLASAGRDRVIRVWDTGTGKEAMALTGHMGMIHTLSCTVAAGESSRGGESDRQQHGSLAMLASGSSDCTVRLWGFEIGATDAPPAAGADTPLAQCRRHGEPLRGHFRGIHSAVFSPCGKTLAVASGDSLITLWDVVHSDAEATKTQVLKGHLSAVFCLAFSPSGKILASGGDDRYVVCKCVVWA